MAQPVNLHEAFEDLKEQWSPRIVAHLNDYDLKVVELDGEFIWHQHDETDELFLCMQGELEIQLESADTEKVVLHEGDLYVVPRGVRHRPVANGTTRALLIEPSGTPNTGEVKTNYTTTGEDT